MASSCSTCRSRTLAVWSLAAAAAAAATSQPPPPSFTETIEVNVINVRVNVTDRDGRPVLGLTPDDFEIYEDGERMEISNFYVGEGRERSPTSRSVPLPDARPATEEAGFDDLRQLRHVVVVIDNTNLRPDNRSKVADAFRSYFDRELDVRDRIMVVTIHQRYQVRLPFTSDPALIERTLTEIEDDPADGTFVGATLRMLIREIDAFSISGSQDRELAAAQMRSTKRAILVAIEQKARLDHQRVRATIEALRYLAGSLAGLPGRKVVLYVSEGLPMRPAEGLFHAHYQKFADLEASLTGVASDLDPPEVAALTYDLSGEFEDLVQHLQAAGITLCAIDAAGQRPLESNSAARRRTDLRTADLSSGGWTTRTDLLHERNLQSPLRLTSTETGGRLLVANRDYRGFLGDLWSDLDHHYSLGYQAPHPMEGRFYEIEVKVKRDGVRVRHPRSYADKTWEHRLVDLAVSRLLLGEGSNPLEIEISPGEPVAKTEGLHTRFVQPLRIFVPMDRLLLIPDRDRRLGKALMVVIVKDDLGNTSPPRLIRLQVDFDEVSGSDEPGRAHADLDLLMRPGEQTIVVGVRDELAGEMSTAAKTVWLVPSVETEVGSATESTLPGG